MNTLSRVATTAGAAASHRDQPEEDWVCTSGAACLRLRTHLCGDIPQPRPAGDEAPVFA
jgi:hypothetical protein